MKKSRLIRDVSNYLFKVINERAVAADIPLLRAIETGQTASAEFCQAYPCLFLACKSRELSTFWTRYDLTLGIAITGTTPQQAEEMGDAYEDILEDIYREDCHLGGLIIDIVDSTTISGSEINQCWFVYSELSIEVDNE